MMTNKKITIFLVAAFFILAFSSCSKKHHNLSNASFETDYTQELEGNVPGVKFAVAPGTPGNPLSAGVYHTCAVTSTGAVKCWGDNSSGELGNGTTTTSLGPVDVSGLTAGIIAVKGGGALDTFPPHTFTCALTSAGTVKCWGNNNYGMLGNGTTTDSFTPVDVSGLDGIEEITAGGKHACILNSQDRIKCWGENSSGQLGDGTLVNSSIPVDVKFGGKGKRKLRATSITAGGHHTCAITTQDKVKCWGLNSHGQVGQTSDNMASTPVDVPGLQNIFTLSAGDNHTCAVTNTGNVQCWGDNSDGQLGSDTVTGSSVPLDVPGLTDAVAVSAGGKHTCVITTSGEVQCWGDNSSGQLGNGTTENSFTPVNVSGVANVVALSAGGNHTCAMTSSGVILCWGGNYYGQLGNGTTTESAMAVSVAGF